jgi:outer membrane protein TolC
MMKRTVIFTIMMMSSLILIVPRADADVLTLAAALERAERESPGVLASEAAVDAAAGKAQMATGMLLPQLTVSETFARTDDQVGVFATKLHQAKFTVADFNLPNLNNPNAVNDWHTRIELGAPIIHSGVNWANRRAAKDGLSAVGHMRDHGVSSIKLAVTKLYYSGVAMAQQRLAIGAAIKRLRGLENSYQLMQAPNSATTTSYLVARSVRTNLEAEAVRIDCYRDAAIRNLNAILGDDPETPRNLVDPLPSVSTIRAKGSEDKQVRSDVLAADASAKAAAAARSAALRSWGPNLDAVTAYNRHTGDFESSSGSYEVGVRLSWPIFSGPRFGQVRKAKAEALRARHESEALDLQASADLNTATANLKSCVGRYATIKRAYGFAAEALGVARTRYSEGTLPLKDYSQAVQNWAQMHMNFIQSHLDAAFSQANYDFQRNAL